MRVIVYIRVSTKEQTEGYSLDSQEKACREFCEKQGWEVVKVFREEGESAKTADRTQLIELLKFCGENKGKTDILLVHKLDRIARQSSDHHAIRATLSRYHVVLRSVTEPIDETSQGKFMENIYSAVAQLDNDVRAERSKSGLVERVRQGLWAWKAPIGYRNTEQGLEIDEGKAPLVKKAFEVFAQGNTTVKQLALKMSKWGLRTEKGKKIRPQMVSQLLRNKLYIGIIEVAKWNFIKDGLHEKLVDPKTFYQVQEILEGKSSTSVARLVNNPDFPLKNVAVCHKCGKRLTGSWSKGRNSRYPYYHCVCGAVRVTKNTLEALFLAYLKNIKPNLQFRRLFAEVFMDVWRTKQHDATKSVTALEKELVSLKESKTKLIQKNLDGILSDADIRDSLDRLNGQITVKEIERSEYREREVDVDQLLALAEGLFENVAVIWMEVPFQYKQSFQRLLFPKGLLVDEKTIGTAELGLPFSLNTEKIVTRETLVPPRGFEPLIYWLKTSRPRPLDDGGMPC